MEYLLYIAILPVVLLLSYIYKKDAHKEPTKVLVKVFAFGALTVIPAIILELLLRPYFPTDNYYNSIKFFINVLIGIALVEEMLKWLVVKILIYKDQNFDESFDGIIYAVFASLGFACIENILYVFTGGIGTGIARAITAIPLHACTGVLMGYTIGKAKLYAVQNDKSKETQYLLLSIIVPTLIHAIYDFLALSQKTELVIILFAFIVGTYITCFIIIKKSVQNNRDIILNDPVVEEPNNTEPTNSIQGTYCTFCGHRIDNSNYCEHCGKRNESSIK